MSIGEEDLAGRIARRLDSGLPSIDQRTSARLRSARETALERLESQPAWAAATAGGAATGKGFRSEYNLRHLVSIATLIAVIWGMIYWQSVQHEEPLDIDAKLLSGDLPIDAYLDKGLDAWLTR